MSRALYAGCLLGWIIIAGGCAMCAGPYDYCGPVVDDPQSCCPNARAGSILAAGGGYGVPEGTTTPTQPKKKSAQPTPAPQRTRALSPPKPLPRNATPRPAPTPAPANTAPTEQSASRFFPGIPRQNILSITDRRADEVEEAKDASVAQEEPAQRIRMPLLQAASTAPPAKQSSPIKQTGWTARDTSASE